MEDASEIKYQAKPTIKRDKLPYLKPGEKEIYVNLFKIKINKPLKLFQYPYSVSPEIDAADLRIRNKLFKYAGIGTKKDRKRLKDFYGECFISGDSLYGMNEVKESKTFNCKLYLDGETEYTITIQPKANQRTINQNDLEKDPLTKQFIEILIQDILRANPNLDFYRGLFVLKNQKKVIDSKNNGSVNFYPGYTTSFMETESGNYLNVTLKNKILSTDTVLEFDRDPKSHNFMHDGKTKTLEEYYKEKYKINIKDLTQPLIVVKKKDAQGKDFNLYFVPEMCYLAGLDDEFLKDREFMKNLANYTKLDPKFRITKTNEFLKLLVETKNKEIKRDGKVIKELSSKEKSELYGIEISALDQLHKAYNMKDTELLAGKKKAITAKDKIFDVISKKDMSHWICLYRKSNYNDAEKLYNTLDDASHDYGLSIAEPEWVEMEDNDNEEEWAHTANDYMKEVSEKDKNAKKYSFALFLLDRNDRIYSTLKYYSLCEHGYISQVVKASSLHKNALSVCSKILLQINAKLSGVSYIAKFDKNIKDRNLMIIGVDSSHIRGKRTGVAMVATINPSFTNFYNKEQIILEEKKESFLISISSFIEEAIQKYNEINKTYPKGIIIYRQGVSFQQKEFLKNEVINIQKVCDKNKLLYEYILVNTKTTYKFFEKDKGGYKNPDGGLLVLSGVTNRDLFEFYIQPQQVTGGSATPSCFTVAYGNMDFPEIIPKLTFDFCHLYSNWQGTVRVPHVLKLAEKLSKMTAKYTEAELHKNLSINQAYL